MSEKEIIRDFFQKGIKKLDDTIAKMEKADPKLFSEESKKPN